MLPKTFLRAFISPKSLHWTSCLSFHSSVKQASPAGGAIVGNANWFRLAGVTKMLSSFLKKINDSWCLMQPQNNRPYWIFINTVSCLKVFCTDNHLIQDQAVGIKITFSIHCFSELFSYSLVPRERRRFRHD